MRKLKADVVLIGSGIACMFAASRMHALGIDVLIVNPSAEFRIGDLRPRHGTSLWTAAYQSSDKTKSLADHYELLQERLGEVFPASREDSGVKKIECWSVLSSTPIHRERTEALEKEFFKVERRPFSTGHFRLVSPENVDAIARRYGIDFSDVAQVGGAVQRGYGLTWDAVELGYHLTQFVNEKFKDKVVFGAEIRKKVGKRLDIEMPDGEEVLVEALKSVVIMFSGDLIPDLKTIIEPCNEPWIQGIKKRRRERHYVWFERERPFEKKIVNAPNDAVWLGLGDTHYLWNSDGSGMACWSVRGGPDGIDRVVDEGIRVQSASNDHPRFTRTTREFWLEWEWRAPAWRKTSHDTYWGTSFEGDLPATLELVWNLPMAT